MQPGYLPSFATKDLWSRAVASQTSSQHATRLMAWSVGSRGLSTGQQSKERLPPSAGQTTKLAWGSPERPSGQPATAAPLVSLAAGDRLGAVVETAKPPLPMYNKKSEWGHLETGVLIRTDRGASVHLSTSQPSDGLEPIRT